MFHEMKVLVALFTAIFPDHRRLSGPEYSTNSFCMAKLLNALQPPYFTEEKTEAGTSVSSNWSSSWVVVWLQSSPFQMSKKTVAVIPVGYPVPSFWTSIWIRCNENLNLFTQSVHQLNHSKWSAYCVPEPLLCAGNIEPNYRGFPPLGVPTYKLK